MRDYERYLVEVKQQYPLLTPELEIDLANRMRSNDQSARERLILSNLRLVLKIASRYAHNGDLPDLVSAGSIGLVKAVDTYDPTKINPYTNKPYRFSTHAYRYIRYSILDSLRRNYTSTSSLDTLLENGTIQDENIMNPEEFAMRAETSTMVRKALEDLTPKQKGVTQLRFGLNDGIDRTYPEIALHMGMKYQQSPHQLGQTALERLKVNPLIISLN